jgi:hypothetical protein
MGRENDAVCIEEMKWNECKSLIENFKEEVTW